MWCGWNFHLRGRLGEEFDVESMLGKAMAQPFSHLIYFNPGIMAIFGRHPHLTEHNYENKAANLDPRRNYESSSTMQLTFTLSTSDSVAATSDHLLLTPVMVVVYSTVRFLRACRCYINF